MDYDTRVGAYAVIVRDEHVLLSRWAPDPTQLHYRPGLGPSWTLPGGGLEAGEPPEAAAVREVLEETGYVVELARILGTDSVYIGAEDRLPGHPRRPLHSLRIVYEGRVVDGELRVEVGGSTDAVRWFPLEHVESLQRVSLVDAGIRLWRRGRLRADAPGTAGARP